MSSHTTNQKSDLSVTHGEQLGKEVTPSYSEMIEMEKSPEHLRAIEMVAQYESGLITASELRRTNIDVYRNFDGMKQRCRKSKIPLDPEFEKFPSFLKLAGPRPEKSWSIDRINPKGPYSPQNCRWASKKVQARNRSNTVTITSQGETRPLVEWAEIKGENPELYRARKRDGWSDEEIISGVKNKVLSQPDSDGRVPSIFHQTPWLTGHELFLETAYQRYKNEDEGRLHFMERHSKKRIGEISERADIHTWPEGFEPTSNQVIAAEKDAIEMTFWKKVLAAFDSRKSKNPMFLKSDRPLSSKIESQLQDFVAKNWRPPSSKVAK